jgi:hypothetical protein
MIVMSMCSTSAQEYAINFVAQGQGNWEAANAIRLPEGKGGRKFAPGSMTGSFWAGPGYACPFCESVDFFLCGTCNSLSCMGSVRLADGKRWVDCRHCNTGGYIEGSIAGLSGFGDLG